MKTQRFPLTALFALITLFISLTPVLAQKPTPKTKAAVTASDHTNAKPADLIQRSTVRPSRSIPTIDQMKATTVFTGTVPVSPTGTLQLSTLVGDTGEDIHVSSVEDTDGTIYSAGSTYHLIYNTNVDYQALVTKILTTGEVLTRTMGLPGDDKVVDIKLWGTNQLAVLIESNSAMTTTWRYSDSNQVGAKDILLFILNRADLSTVTSIETGGTYNDWPVNIITQGQCVGFLAWTDSFGYPVSIPGNYMLGESDAVITMFRMDLPTPEVCVSKFLNAPYHDIVHKAIQYGTRIFYIGDFVDANGFWRPFLQSYNLSTLNVSAQIQLATNTAYAADVASDASSVYVVGSRGIAQFASGLYMVFSHQLELQYTAPQYTLPMLQGVTVFQGAPLLVTLSADDEGMEHYDSGLLFMEGTNPRSEFFSLGGDRYNTYISNIKPSSSGQEIILSGDTSAENFYTTNGTINQGRSDAFTARVKVSDPEPEPAPFQNWLPFVTK